MLEEAQGKTRWNSEGNFVTGKNRISSHTFSDATHTAAITPELTSSENFAFFMQCSTENCGGEFFSFSTRFAYRFSSYSGSSRFFSPFYAFTHTPHCDIKTLSLLLWCSSLLLISNRGWIFFYGDFIVSNLNWKCVEFASFKDCTLWQALWCRGIYKLAKFYGCMSGVNVGFQAQRPSSSSSDLGIQPNV